MATNRPKENEGIKRPRVARLTASAARLNRAVREGDIARAELALRSHPDSPHHIVDPSLAWLEGALEKVRPSLLSYEGVVGVGLGFRASKGTQTREPCITVFVKKKVSQDQLSKKRHRALPKFKRIDRRTIKIDVVQFGELQPHAGIGDDIGPMTSRLAGTIGLFARDTLSNVTVAITAMHVSGVREVPSPVVTSIDFSTPSRLTNGSSPLFARLIRGTMSQIDAAKLELLNPHSTGGLIPGLGPIAGWRPLTYPGDMQTTVFMFGAVSGLTQGFITNTSMDLLSDNLKSTIIVNIPSEPGDSGAVLVDSQRFVLGFLVGEGNAALGRNLRIFCPAGLVFGMLGCDIP
ncbi:hypothetical protein [Cellvibrio sp. PSBB023]|uniref:hypothetical protein n=1 Tax=Cellvibrio sp. PSBB023 TaxID=1945512 RepID=UPI00098EF07E|nr:hypothetical protein [Cellvibrio sp. PSBB023]AQT61245.1 hypothetical protein B0D95_14885 [Cellvibrio sp. PSBB023]